MNQAPPAGSLAEIPYKQMLRYHSLAQGDITRARKWRGMRHVEGLEHIPGLRELSESSIVLRINVKSARNNWRHFLWWRRILRAMEMGDLALASQVLATGGPHGQ